MTMQEARRTADERREHPRRVAPQLYVRIGGRVYHTVEWSFGGLVIEAPEGRLAAGQLVRIDGIADETAYRRAETPVAVDIRARVARRIPGSGRVALSCLHLDGAAYAVMAAVQDGLTPMAEAPA